MLLIFMLKTFLAALALHHSSVDDVFFLVLCFKLSILSRTYYVYCKVK